MDNNNKNFNEFPIEILKQIHIRLDRLDAKIDTEIYKGNVRSLEKQLDRIEASIKELSYVIGIETAVIIIILAIFKAF